MLSFLPTRTARSKKKDSDVVTDGTVGWRRRKIHCPFAIVVWDAIDGDAVDDPPLINVRIKTDGFRSLPPLMANWLCGNIKSNAGVDNDQN